MKDFIKPNKGKILLFLFLFLFSLMLPLGFPFPDNVYESITEYAKYAVNDINCIPCLSCDSRSCFNDKLCHNYFNDDDQLRMLKGQIIGSIFYFPIVIIIFFIFYLVSNFIYHSFLNSNVKINKYIIFLAFTFIIIFDLFMISNYHELGIFFEKLFL